MVAPDDYVQRYGADTVRGYLMFIDPWDQGGPWDPQRIEGVRRFLNRVWNVMTEPAEADTQDASAARQLEQKLHATIAKVTADFEHFRFNTAISALMELLATYHFGHDKPPTRAWIEGRGLGPRLRLKA